MRRLRRDFLALGVAGVTLIAVASTAGCFRREYPTKRQYVVNVERGGAPRTPGNGVLRLRPVTATTQYDRKSLVYRTGELTYVDDFYNAFYVPPARMIAAVASEWLADSGLFAAVVDAGSIAQADYLLELELSALYVDRRDEKAHASVAGIKATLLAVGRSSPHALFEKRYVASKPCSARNGDAYDEAWGAALASGLAELEDEIAKAVAR